MTNVLIAAGTFRSSVIFVLVILKESDNVIDCVRPGVVGIEPQASGKISLEGRLQRIVVRLRITADYEDVAEVSRQRPSLRYRISSIYVSRGNDTVCQKVRHMITDIPDLQSAEAEVMLNIQRPMLRHCRLKISFDVISIRDRTCKRRWIDRILRKDSAKNQCSKQIDRFRRKSVCLRRAEAGGQITVVENSITAPKHSFLIAEHIERKTETRAEIILINIMQLLPAGCERQRVKVEVLQTPFFFTAHGAHVVTQSQIQRQTRMYLPIVLDKKRKILVRIIEQRIAAPGNNKWNIVPKIIQREEDKCFLILRTGRTAIEPNVSTGLERVIPSNRTQSVKKMIDRASAELFKLRRSRNREGLISER